ncbi:MAG: DUF1844 domain-containing protein [Calditrichaeota bacterium]|nr:DUF1844 domain-containing protein [Calditrichota bacterium]RQV99582.1 MAG: DUF1844 domain-containing protein [Calditrichota bacterium]
MTDPNENNNKTKALFITLIQQLQMQGWISLGRIKDPKTDKIERNLEMAVYTIDTLEMFREKTTGNLDDDEMKLLEESLAILKQSYTEEVQKRDENPSE